MTQEPNDGTSASSEVPVVSVVWYLPPPDFRWADRQFRGVCQTQDGVMRYLEYLERQSASNGGGYIAEEVPLWP